MVINKRCRGVFHSLWLLFTLLFLLSACLPQSTQPIARIGLIAPFEGLYRRTGYELLAAMRMAISEHAADGSTGAFAVIPQALNDSGQPAQAERVFEKLLVDPTVAAMIAPLSPWVGLTIAEGDSEKPRLPGDLFAHGATWLGVWTRDEDASATAQPPINSPFEMKSLLVAVADAAVEQGAKRLLMAGAIPDFVRPVGAGSNIEILPFQSLAQVESTDALLWLGDPAEGARLLNQLRAVQPEVPFWMGPLGGDPVFADHGLDHNRVFWAIWRDANYNQWAETHSSSSPLAYLVYHQTEWALWHLTNSAKIVSDDSSWMIVFFQLDESGQSQPYEP